ncbi:uncharacterized protein [Periplaneta americana]|uniref:uncharacterized protein isoform X6 n=1 Tax=Periplaneta americana TaxID=6978 RepID=UPI0037E71686
MDLIKFEQDVDYESSRIDPISNMKDEQECIIPFIKTEASNLPDYGYGSYGETHQTSNASDAKKEEEIRAINCHEMKCEIKEEVITVKEEWNDTKILEPEAQLNRFAANCMLMQWV